ncbi:MAG: hypothetical protein FRX49_08041 [Trebouxia sp. A1-2]|nr:MAG: hypothetical protein FRX49_08041 [Trebouxia sp. A1-2]
MPRNYFTGAHARHVLEKEKREGGGEGGWWTMGKKAIGNTTDDHTIRTCSKGVIRLLTFNDTQSGQGKATFASGLSGRKGESTSFLHCRGATRALTEYKHHNSKTRLAVVKQPYLHCNVMTLMYG